MRNLFSEFLYGLRDLLLDTVERDFARLARLFEKNK